MTTRFRCRVPDQGVRPIVRRLETALLLLLVVRTQAQTNEHVIVTADTFVRSFAPLGQFVEDELELRDTTVTMEYIYAHYLGRDEPERIRNFIRFAYQNWGTTHILLDGDRAQACAPQR